jgi:hypothetical protein
LDLDKKQTRSSRPDPILRAIERHRLADAALDAAIAADNDEEAKDLTMAAELRAFWGLVEVRPTTAKGIWALCDHLADYSARLDLVSDRADYNRARRWRFMPRLLENIRDALTEIE